MGRGSYWRATAPIDLPGCLGFLQMSRKSLILALLTAISLLGVASPSLAADAGIGVEPTFEFAPNTQALAVGDTVTWTFNDGGHTTTSLPAQPDKWDSGIEEKGAT